MANANPNKNVIIVVLIAVVAALGFALYKNQHQSDEFKMTLPGDKEIKLEVPKHE